MPIREQNPNPNVLFFSSILTKITDVILPLRLWVRTWATVKGFVNHYQLWCLSDYNEMARE